MPPSPSVNTLEPGLLAPPSFTIGGAQHIVALLGNSLTYILPVNVPGIATSRAKPGDTLTLYGIGFGPVVPDIPAGQIVQQSNALQFPVQFTFAGVPGRVTYQGLAPGYVGLDQFNVVVPNVPAGDAVPLRFTISDAPARQALVIAIQN